MEPIEYRNRDARRSLVLTAVTCVWGLVSAVRLMRGAEPGFLDALGIAWLVIAPFLLNVTLARIVVGPEGIVARRPFFRRTYSWDEISGIVVEKQAGHGYGAYRVKILRHGRRPRVLPAPYVDMRAGHERHEELLARAEDLRARHRTALARRAPGSGDGSPGPVRGPSQG
ncbi:hypothetical protein ACWDR0_32655 [Streptomyces sp. NPDC003691]